MQLIKNQQDELDRIRSGRVLEAHARTAEPEEGSEAPGDQREEKRARTDGGLGPDREAMDRIHDCMKQGSRALAGGHHGDLASTLMAAWEGLRGQDPDQEKGRSTGRGSSTALPSKEGEGGDGVSESRRTAATSVVEVAKAAAGCLADALHVARARVVRPTDEPDEQDPGTEAAGATEGGAMKAMETEAPRPSPEKELTSVFGIECRKRQTL